MIVASAQHVSTSTRGSRPLASPAPRSAHFWFRPAGAGAAHADRLRAIRARLDSCAGLRVVPALFTLAADSLEHPTARRVRDILRFWFAAAWTGSGSTRRSAAQGPRCPMSPMRPHPSTTSTIHDVPRWRRVADEYDSRALIARCGCPRSALHQYLRPDELQRRFNVASSAVPGSALMRACSTAPASARGVGAPATGCCPIRRTRHVTLYGRADTTSLDNNLDCKPVDLSSAPARPAAACSAVPAGATYVYQGRARSLENESIPPDRFQDPMWAARHSATAPVPLPGPVRTPFASRWGAVLPSPDVRPPVPAQTATRVRCWSSTARVLLRRAEEGLHRHDAWSSRAGCSRTPVTSSRVCSTVRCFVPPPHVRASSPRPLDARPCHRHASVRCDLQGGSSCPLGKGLLPAPLSC